jgi:hypothetical protein
VKDGFALGHDLVVVRFFDNGGQIVADGFRKAGGVHGHQVGVVHTEYGLQRLPQVGRSTKHGGPFGKGTGGGHNRFLEVPGQVAAVIGTAALTAVTVRKASVDAQGGIHGADRLTCLGRVYS